MVLSYTDAMKNSKERMCVFYVGIDALAGINFVAFHNWQASAVAGVEKYS